MTKVLLEEHEGSICTLTLNRPELANAFNPGLINALYNTLEQLAEQDQLRVIVLSATGKVFCGGGDLNWMATAANYNEQENYQDALRLAKLLYRLNSMPQVTIAKINGTAFGGGVGLISCCDIAIAVESAQFALSELKLGLVPATIFPYAHAAIGGRNARRYFLTAERFDAAMALQLGLVHELVDEGGLDTAVERLCKSICSNGPSASQYCKQLLLADGDMDLVDKTAKRLAKSRSSAEAREGIAAFLEKRKASWCL